MMSLKIAHCLPEADTGFSENGGGGVVAGMGMDISYLDIS